MLEAGISDHLATGGPNRRPPPDARLALKLLWIALGLSFLINALSFFGFYSAWTNPRDFSLDQSINQPTQVTLSSEQLEVVDSFQKEAVERPETAQFASDRNLQADEETSPDAVSNIPQVGNSGADDTDKQGRPQSPQEKKVMESFSLSDSDLVALNDPLLSARAQKQKGVFSPGFVRRLQRGEELKVNAFGLDYGQYIVRMRERLAQRWNWKKSLTANMYNYQQISVQVAVVLNSEGQLEDIRVIKSSFFESFDDVAIEAFKKAEPFPNPPQSLIQDDNRVYLPWEFLLSLDGFGQVQ